MFTAIITAAWRGFGFHAGDEFKELRLGFISFAIVQGTLWESYRELKDSSMKLKNKNDELIKIIKQHDFCGND